MRVSLPLLVGALLISPEAAACSFGILYGASHPEDGALAAPANAQVAVETYFFAQWPMTALLLDHNGTETTPLAVRPIGRDVIVLDLPALDPNLEYEIRIQLDDEPAGEKRIKLATSGVRDEQPPTLTDRLDLTAQPSDLGSCGNPGDWIVRANIDPATDDVGVGLYILYEMFPDDGIAVVASALAPPNGGAPVLFTEIAEADFGSHCYFVEAQDLAGNSSAIASIGCVDVGPTLDGGMPVPPLPEDAGTQTDSGRPPIDRRLTTDSPGCGCTQTEAHSGPPWLLLAGLLLIFRRK